MAPPSDDDQTSLSYRLKTTPQAPVSSYRDGFGNRVDLFNVTTPYHELAVQTTSYVRTHRRPVESRLSASRAYWAGPGSSAGPEGASTSTAVEALEYLQPSLLVPNCPELDAFVATVAAGLEPGPLGEVLDQLMGAVGDRIIYEKSVTRPRTDVAEALALGRGVCQDFAHVFIGVCRALGLPARYVSGYLSHPGEIATHAWCQVWAGEVAGWVDVDPTHDEFVGDEHVTTAVGRDYHDVPPNRGLWNGRAEESMSVSVKVEPVDRVPVEWHDWYPSSFRSSAQSQTQWPGNGGQRQSQGLRQRTRPKNRTVAAYPDQPAPRDGLINQQCEQQQQQQH
jgi:transglutaminase-like putative cysteine protease